MTPTDRTTNLKAGIGLCLLFGIIFGMMAWQDFSDLRVLQTEPLEMTLAELIQSSGGSRRHVVLTDFHFTEGYAYMESSGVYSDVYLPIIPADDPRPTEIHAVVESAQIQTPNGVQALQRQLTVSGICSAERSGFGVTVGPLLEEAVPGLMLNEAWRIRYFKQPPSLKGMRTILIAASACLILAGFLSWRLRVSSSISRTVGGSP